MKKTLLICIMCLVTVLCLCLSACSPKHTHDFSSGVYKSTATGHSEKCKDDDTYGPEEAHTFGEDGKCTVCGYEHTHSFTSKEYDKTDAGHREKCANCNQYGEIEQHTFGTDNKCTVCGYVKTESSAHEHTLTKVDKKDPTCTEKGNIEYYTCNGEDCSGKYFDKDGKELDEKDVFIDTIPHDFTSGKYESTETGHKQKCKNCNTYETEEHDHEFVDGECKVCGYKENSEDLELPENLDGEYKNVNGATITIKDTKVTVKMSDQVQKPNEYTITGYDDEGNITVEPDIDLGGGEQGKITLIFNEENETLTAGYLGTFYKVKEFDLPETLDGTYVNEDEEEIVVSNEDKTVTIGEKDYIIIYYSDDEENNLILFGKTEGDIISMTYDDEADKLTYNDDEYSKKEEEEELKLPDNLSGKYQNEYGATIVIDGKSFDLTMPQQQQPTHCTITGYDETTGKLTLDPPLNLGGPAASEVIFDKDDETIELTALQSTFNKVKEEEPEKPEIPEDINGVYKKENESVYLLVLDKKTIFVEGGTDDHNCEIGDYTFEDDTYNLKTTCSEHSNATENWTYNKEDKTITNSDGDTFEEYSPELPEGLEGVYEYVSGRNTYTITVEEDILTHKTSSYGNPDVFTIVEYNNTNGKISGMRHNNGYFKTYTYDSDNDTITDDWESQTYKRPVEAPTLDLPKSLIGEYFTQDEGSEIDVEGDTFDYYEDEYTEYPDTYTITEYKDGKGTLEGEYGETATFTYDEETDTITFKNKQYKKDWSDPAPQTAEAPSWMIGTWDNGSSIPTQLQYFVIDKTSVKRYRGSTSGNPTSTFDIVSVSNGTMTLNCTYGGMTDAHIDWIDSVYNTITFIAKDNLGLPVTVTLGNKTGGVEETPETPAETTVPGWLIGAWVDNNTGSSQNKLVIDNSSVKKYRGANLTSTFDIVSVSGTTMSLKNETATATITWTDENSISFSGTGMSPINSLTKMGVELPSWLSGSFMDGDFTEYYSIDSSGILFSSFTGGGTSSWEAVSLENNVLTIKNKDNGETKQLELHEDTLSFTVDGKTYTRL